MKLWIARGEGDNYCILFKEKPYKYYDKFCKKNFFITDNMLGTYMCLLADEFPEVTFENSPMEVELVIKKQESYESNRITDWRLGWKSL